MAAKIGAMMLYLPISVEILFAGALGTAVLA